MAYPRRKESEPIKRISLNLPWTLYQQINHAESVNAEIIRLLKLAIQVESEFGFNPNEQK